MRWFSVFILILCNEIRYKAFFEASNPSYLIPWKSKNYKKSHKNLIFFPLGFCTGAHTLSQDTSACEWLLRPHTSTAMYMFSCFCCAPGWFATYTAMLCAVSVCTLQKYVEWIIKISQIRQWWDEVIREAHLIPSYLMRTDENLMRLVLCLI